LEFVKEMTEGERKLLETQEMEKWKELRSYIIWLYEELVGLTLTITN
jgi:hypothetical protein